MFLYNTLPRTVWVFKVLVKAVSPYYPFEISSVSNWLQVKWFCCSSKKKGQIVHQVRHILYAPDVQNMWRSIGNEHYLKQALFTEINECCTLALCYSWKVLCIKITSYTKHNYDMILKIRILLFSSSMLDNQAAAHLSFWQAVTVQSPAKTREFIKKSTFFTRMSLPLVKTQNKDCRIKGHIKILRNRLRQVETQRRSKTKGAHLVNI